VLVLFKLVCESTTGYQAVACTVLLRFAPVVSLSW